ncbi:zonular occludens toxin domain-containing protein [Photobacterium marinum]|uniref:zonular occludens toxin domain-containing protein n=1 Tax=Photobacterium marinum TaxID=1056511 RepID=UPI000566EF8B|nr:zonular occludens toxin domain-containing protein [Photobacterium marinum]
MIYLIAGRPRSGKSYEAVKYHVIPAIKSGRKVITNLPLNIEHFKKIYGAEVEELIKVVEFDYADFEGATVTFPFSTPDYYMDDWRDDKGVGPLYVIDEAHFSLPKGKTLDAVKKYYTMHEHYGIDILLMTQNPRQLDADILNLVEILYRTIKNTALGSTSTYTKKVVDGWRGAVVNEEQRKYDKTIFPFYKSHTQSKKEVLEREASDIKPIWKHWSFVGGALFLLLGIPWLIYSLAGLFSDEEPEPEPVPVIEVVAEKPASVDDGSPGRPPEDIEIDGPLSGFDMFITGWARQVYYYDDMRDYDINQNFYLVYLDVYKGASKRFSITNRDLVSMGYKFVALSDCVFKLEFGGEQRIVTCKVDEKQKGDGGMMDAFNAVGTPSFAI